LSRKVFPLILLSLGSILILVSAYILLRNPTPQTNLSTVPAKVRFPAPELTLSDTQGASRSLADYQGQVVLVNLWATWCAPCKEEMPTLQAYYHKYKEDGFVIVAINDGDPATDVLKFVEDYELTFPVWLDPTYIATEQAFHTLNLPTSFVIDRSGTIQLTWMGEISAEMLENYVTPLITEPS
jgi:cytochrome c biogenesis protein CcmG, thiol:disulfide interchange protein DsbE